MKEGRAWSRGPSGTHGPKGPALVLATGNAAKVREFGAMMQALEIEVIPLCRLGAVPLPEERAETFEENALAKARFVADLTGMAALADDSGLVVDALGGRPGVRSSRYAGPGATDEENVKRLLEELDGVPPEERTARFVCVIALVIPGAAERTFRGVLEGAIAPAAEGSGGFGYDPVFLIPERGLTAACLEPEEKNALSHRGRAMRRLVEFLGEGGMELLCRSGGRGRGRTSVT